MRKTKTKEPSKTSVYGYPGFNPANQRSRMKGAIEKVIYAHYNQTFEELASNTRRREVKDVRFLAMYFLKVRNRSTYEYIGELFGGRDHSTVISAVQRVKDWIETEKAYRENVEKMDQEITLLCFR